MGRRYYANSAPQQTLQAAITNSETVITVTSWTGWPTSPFYATIGLGTASEEIVLVTSISGTTANVVRSQDGTPAVPHSAGETLNQTVIRLDLDEANAHVNATSDIHGVTGALAAASDLALKANTADLGTSAALNVGIVTGTVAAGDDSRIVGAAQAALNLSDLTNAGSARANLGLKNSATLDVGTIAGTVAAGDDSRFVGLPTSTKVSAYTLVGTDAGTVIELNASAATTITVPAGVFTGGQIVEVAQYGVGQATLGAGSGMTLRTAGSTTTRTQYSSIFIRFRSGSEAVISGDMA